MKKNIKLACLNAICFFSLVTANFGCETNIFINKKVLFSLKYFDGIGFLIDPIAFLDNGKPINLPEELLDEEKGKYFSELFNETFYKIGDKLSVFFSGIKCGSIVIQGPKQDFTCDSLTAKVDLSSNIELAKKDMALVGNFDEMCRSNFRKTSLAEQETKQIVNLAKNLYLKKGVSNTLIDNINISGIAYFKRDAHQIIIGSFNIKSEDKSVNGFHSLFLIAEKNNSPLEVKYFWYQYGEDANLEFRSLIDIFNIDNDNYPELIIYCKYYESWDYKILKKIKNKWEIIYSGGSGGC